MRFIIRAVSSIVFLVSVQAHGLQIQKTKIYSVGATDKGERYIGASTPTTCKYGIMYLPSTPAGNSLYSLSMAASLAERNIYYLSYTQDPVTLKCTVVQIQWDEK